MHCNITSVCKKSEMLIVLNKFSCHDFSNSHFKSLTNWVQVFLFFPLLLSRISLTMVSDSVHAFHSPVTIPWARRIVFAQELPTLRVSAPLSPFREKLCVKLNQAKRCLVPGVR